MTRRESIDIIPCGPIFGSIRPPGSKSLTNRALVCAALASGESHLDGVLDSEDTRVMIDSLGRLGISVAHDPLARTAIVRGCDGAIPATSARLHVANSGTTIRFLAAMVALGHGRFELDGVERMRQRPIGDLIEALRRLSVSADALSPGGCPPVRIDADGLPGGSTEVAGSVSSQFLSGLLLAAPYAAGPLTIRVVGSLVSRPYIEMTLAVMRRFGAEVKDAPSGDSFVVGNARRYVGRRESIEPDASAASYFWGAAAITGGRVTVEGLGPSALQGDVRFVDVLERMGCTVERHDDRITVVGGRLTGIDVDMNAISDTVQTLAAVALFADGPTRVRGVAHNRHKETDRIGDLATELRRLGAQVDEHEDGLTIAPQPLRGTALRTYGDHRMAMSLALVGLRVPDVTILDPECTSKTYPEFFDDLDRLTGPSRV